MSFCKENGICVIGIIPPFSKKVYETAINSGNFNYWNKVYPSTLPIFKKHGFELYDFSNPSLMNSSDLEMIDGFHGGEVAYLKIIIEVLKAKSLLNEAASLQTLEKDLLNKKNNYQVYGM